MADYDVYDHHDLQAMCLDVDATSRFLAMAGTKYVAVLNAGDPENCDVKHVRRSRTDVGCIRWCTTDINRTYLALTSGQSFELYLMQSGSSGLQAMTTVRAHARVVTDLDWDHFNAYRLATCAVDDHVYIWDLRDLRKPSLTLNVVAGANQVKWAKLLENLCATCSDGDMRIWDVRKGNSPVQYIAAHVAKVHSIDWHPKNDVLLVSCSQDCSVKLWDFTKPAKPEAQVNLVTPVWKAKFAPFGNGLLTTIPTPDVSQTEHALTLWRCNDYFLSAVHNVLGHTDLILDFCWRQAASSDSRDYVQIMSLSKDHSLRVWSLDAQTQQLCDQKRPTIDGETVDRTSTGDWDVFVERYDTSPDDPSFVIAIKNKSTAHLKAEIGSLNGVQINGALVETIDGNTGATFNVEHVSHTIKLIITVISKEASDAAQLLFRLSASANLSNSTKAAILQRLQELCEQTLLQKETVLLACLSNLHEIVGQVMSNEPKPSSVENGIILQSPQITPSPSILTTFLDARVPFPRTTGAHFNAVGILVCFRRCESGVTVRGQTPRTYAAVANFIREPRSYFSVNTTEYSLKSYYQRDWRPNRRCLSPGVKIRSRDDGSDPMCELFVYDAGAMLPLHKELARNYCFPENFSETEVASTCWKNAKVAATVQRWDLVQAWIALAYCVSPALKPSLDLDLEIPWAMHPFGRALVSSLIEHFSKLGDVQSAATICCVLGERPRHHVQERPCSRASAVSESLGCGSPYNTVHSSEGLYEAWTGYLLRQRSGSLSEQEGEQMPSMEQLTNGDAKTLAVLHEHDNHEKNLKLLDPEMTDRFEALKQSYADILYRWGMLNERASVLKYSLKAQERYRGMEYVVQCRNCSSDCRSPMCADCRIYAMVCVVCQMTVRGLCSVCSVCGHGGHTLHLASWFRKNAKCPSGCGCYCLLA